MPLTLNSAQELASTITDADNLAIGVSFVLCDLMVVGVDMMKCIPGGGSDTRVFFDHAAIQRRHVLDVPDLSQIALEYRRCNGINISCRRLMLSGRLRNCGLGAVIVIHRVPPSPLCPGT